MENPLLRKMKILSQILILSVTLNVGLFIALVYTVGEKRFALAEPKELIKETFISTATNAHVITTFFSYSYQELLTELMNHELVEYGYTRRDLALACLVQFHYFDIDKALPNLEMQKRELEFIHQGGGEAIKLTVYPGLHNNHFASIIAFAEKEEWPLTSEGLFYEIKKGGESSSLEEAFFSTHEFYTVYTLFARWFQGISQEEVLSILVGGEWKLISEFAHQVRSAGDLDIEHLRAFILNYIGCSRDVVNLWIHHDSDYLLKRSDDKVLNAVIAAIRSQDLQTTLFLKQILCSVRSDGIRKASGIKLYTLAGEKYPEPYDHETSIKRFLPNFFSTPAPVPEPKTPYERIKVKTEKHVVQEGESLWKIARQHQVDLQTLLEANHLDPDQCLKVGLELTIPK